MTYPIVLSYYEDQFARINHDGSWSVLWDKTEAISKQPKSTSQIPGIKNTFTYSNNYAIRAMAVALMKAKDKMNLTSWEDSNAWADKWCGKEYIIDIEDYELNDIPLQMKWNGNIIMQVNNREIGKLIGLVANLV